MSNDSAISYTSDICEKDDLNAAKFSSVIRTAFKKEHSKEQNHFFDIKTEMKKDAEFLEEHKIDKNPKAQPKAQKNKDINITSLDCSNLDICQHETPNHLKIESLRTSSVKHCQIPNQNPGSSKIDYLHPEKTIGKCHRPTQSNTVSNSGSFANSKGSINSKDKINSSSISISSKKMLKACSNCLNKKCSKKKIVKVEEKNPKIEDLNDSLLKAMPKLNKKTKSSSDSLKFLGHDREQKTLSSQSIHQPKLFEKSVSKIPPQLIIENSLLDPATCRAKNSSCEAKSCLKNAKIEENYFKTPKGQNSSLNTKIRNKTRKATLPEKKQIKFVSTREKFLIEKLKKEFQEKVFVITNSDSLTYEQMTETFASLNMLQGGSKEEEKFLLLAAWRKLNKNSSPFIRKSSLLALVLSIMAYHEPWMSDPDRISCCLTPKSAQKVHREFNLFYSTRMFGSKLTENRAKKASSIFNKVPSSYKSSSTEDAFKTGKNEKGIMSQEEMESCLPEQFKKNTKKFPELNKNLFKPAKEIEENLFTPQVEKKFFSVDYDERKPQKKKKILCLSKKNIQEKPRKSLNALESHVAIPEAKVSERVEKLMEEPKSNEGDSFFTLVKCMKGIASIKINTGNFKENLEFNFKVDDPALVVLDFSNQFGLTKDQEYKLVKELTLIKYKNI